MSTNARPGRQRAVPAPAAAPLDVPPPQSPRRPAAPPPNSSAPVAPAAPPEPAQVQQPEPAAPTSSPPTVVDPMQASMLAEPDIAPALPAMRDDGAGGRAISLAALVDTAPDPELDLVATTLRLPRYVLNALRATSQLSRRSQQNLVTDALKAYLPGELQDQAYLNLTNRPGRR